VGQHHVRRARELAGGQRLALGGDDLGALLALGLGLARVHGVAQISAWAGLVPRLRVASPSCSMARR
jgi:hypothetical protein